MGTGCCDNWSTSLSLHDHVPARAGLPFLLNMPYYYRHASHFEAHTHVRALMRLRCCFDPFVAGPALYYGGLPDCPSCAARPDSDPRTPAPPPETAKHALLDCETYAKRAAGQPPPLSTFFPPPCPAPRERLRAFVRAACVCAGFDRMPPLFMSASSCVLISPPHLRPLHHIGLLVVGLRQATPVTSYHGVLAFGLGQVELQRHKKAIPGVLHLQWP